MAPAALNDLRVRVADLRRALRFFRSVFGWHFVQLTSAKGNQVAVLADQAGSADLILTEESAAPDARLVLATLDLEGALERAQALGGTLERRGKNSAWGTDPEGTPLALLLGPDRRLQAPDSFGPPNVLGSLFVLAGDPERAARFYAGLTGQEFAPAPGEPDALLTVEGAPLGVRPAPPTVDQPRRNLDWQVLALDPPAVAAAVEEAGGTVGEPLGTWPYLRYPCVDDQGMTFTVFSDIPE